MEKNMRYYCELTHCWVRKDGSSVPMPVEILAYGAENVLDVLYWNIVREEREQIS